MFCGVLQLIPIKAATSVQLGMGGNKVSTTHHVCLYSPSHPVLNAKSGLESLPDQVSTRERLSAACPTTPKFTTINLPIAVLV